MSVRDARLLVDTSEFLLVGRFVQWSQCSLAVLIII